MANFNITGRHTVGGIKKQFEAEFGLELRVYKGPKFADLKATLASLSAVKVEDFSCKGNMKVGNFEDKFFEATGLKVQVASLESAVVEPGKLVSNDLTLSQAQKKHQAK